MFKTNSGRPITYYGIEYAKEIKNVEENVCEIHSLNDLFSILLKAWCKETAYPSCQHDYIQTNDPSYGQCAITAMIVHDLFGGTIHKIFVDGGGTHYFNKINGHYIDLTRDQFDLYNIPIHYNHNETVLIEYCGKNPDTQKRYQLLKKIMKEKSKIML